MATKATPAAIGLRVKTGRATAVLLAGTVRAPRVIEKRAVVLADPDVPESGAPYHAAMERGEGEDSEIVRRGCEAAHEAGLLALRRLIDDLRNGDFDPRGVGLVISSDSEPATLGSQHVRAHAYEGQLFREVLEAGAAACGLPCIVLVERDAYDRAARALERTAAELKQAVVDLGASVAKPWAAEQKAAALAAWVALRSR